MPLITLELPALGDVASDLTFVPAFAPVRRTIAAFGGAYVSHAFPSDFPDANGASKPSSPASPTGTSTRSKGSRKKNVKLEDEDLETDWYALLELEDGEGASDEQIKAAYRKRCLDTHPDKQPDGSDVLFKRVQRGFEILGNPVARRSFDSSRPFDDSIPGEGPYKTDEAFYAAFGPAFARNSKWSAEPNMPQIGDNDTPLSDVRRMYDEWLAFHTWRDFSNEVELQEIDEGMMREERRYYQRENQRLLDKCNKEEVKRIRTMVDRAKNNDPRLRRHREAEEAARVKALEERQAARKAAEEAERRAKFEREDKEKAEKEAAKAKAVDSKMALSEMQREILKFMKEHDLIDPVHTNKLLACKVRKPNVTWVVKTANIDEALTLRQAVGDASLEVEAGAPPEGSCDEPDATEHVPAVAQFNLHLKAIEERVGRNRYGEGIKRTVGDASPAARAAKAAAEAAAKKA